jgi:recombination protein RecR/DNA-binding YbaB/EbfC family protein
VVAADSRILQQLMQQAQKMQQQLAEAQAELASSEITGTAGGGLVTVTMTGGGEVRSVKIDPKAVDPDDVETLEDLVVAALANAGDNARKLAEEKMGPLAQGLGGHERRARPARDVARGVRRRHSGPDRRAGPAARRGPEERPAHRVPRPLGRPHRRQAARLCPATGQGTGRFCTTCFNVAESEQCRICRDPRRHDEAICVVEEPKDVVAIEKTGEFRGRYHVLGGAINPLEGCRPDNLRIRELMTRLQSGEVKELILATDPNTEGEATATYLALLVKPMGLRVTRLASGCRSAATSSTPTRSRSAVPSKAAARSSRLIHYNDRLVISGRCGVWDPGTMKRRRRGDSMTSIKLPHRRRTRWTKYSSFPWSKSCRRQVFCGPVVQTGARRDLAHGRGAGRRGPRTARRRRPGLLDHRHARSG